MLNCKSQSFIGQSNKCQNKVDIGHGDISSKVHTVAICTFTLHTQKNRLCIVDVLWGQPIKQNQVASTSELHENQWNDLLFFEIVPCHSCRASEVQT